MLIYTLYILSNTMETICLKMDEKLLKEIDNAIKNSGYSTRTEFVREAIRSKILEKQKEIALKNLEKYFGAGKNHRKTNLSDEEIRQIAFEKTIMKSNLSKKRKNEMIRESRKDLSRYPPNNL